MTKTEQLEERIRKTPLLERLKESRVMVGKMCSEGRSPKMSIPAQPYDEDMFICTTLKDAEAQLEQPIPMLLFCPRCGTQHVDAPEPERGWENPPHKSHQCHNEACVDGNGRRTVWRPADVPTTGVANIQTRGSDDTFGVAKNALG
jgi:hypothetical protein